jgi:hypothetical protein
MVVSVGVVRAFSGNLQHPHRSRSFLRVVYSGVDFDIPHST